MEYHKLSIQTINKYLIYHWIDVLELEDKQTLIEKLYYLKSKDDKLSGYEKYIKMYFDEKKFIISSQKRCIFVGI